jgi:hypothetical protein
MKESGRYQIQFLKTRSSAGVGQKVDLKFDTRTLRISDLSDHEQDAMSATTATVLNQLNRSNLVTDTDKKSDQRTENTEPTRSSLQLRDLIKRTSTVSTGKPQ